MNRRFPIVRAVATLAPAIVFAACDWATLSPVSDFGHMIDDVYWDVIWWTLGILVVVEALLLFALWRFRSRPDDPDVPEQVHGYTWLEIGWTLVPAAILFFIAIPTITTIFETQGEPPQDDPLEVRVVGHQWWWEFEYPDQGFTTANELHVPVDRTVRLTLTSNDVIHSFWVPRLGGKRDLNPGSENVMWFTPDSIGVYEGQCAELCGTSHANMRMRVFVDSVDDFDAWVGVMEGSDAAVPDTSAEVAEATPADTAAPADTTLPTGSLAAGTPDDVGFQTFLASGCAACHAIRGTVAQGRIGPDLTALGLRTTLAAGMIENEPANLAAWLANPDSIKPGALMPDLNLSAGRLDTLVTYLEDLK